LDGALARRKASTYTGQHNTEEYGHTSMPRAGFELTIPVFERSKAVRASDRAATGTGIRPFDTIFFVSDYGLSEK